MTSYPPTQKPIRRRPLAPPVREDQKINLQGAIDLGKATINSLILVNGAAAGGLLTFYGNATAKGSPVPHPGALTASLILFGFGVFAAVCCSICAYISQLAVGSFTGPKHLENPVRYGAMAAGILSAMLFLLGVIAGACAIVANA